MRARLAEADPSLPHQIKLRRANPNAQMTKVTCNCWKNERAIAVIHPAGDPWPEFNKPENHNPDSIPFVQGFEQWKQVTDV